MAYASVRYRYRKKGLNSWTATQWAGNIKSQSETLVMQEIRKLTRHKDDEIELIDLKWK